MELIADVGDGELLTAWMYRDTNGYDITKTYIIPLTILHV